MRYLLLICTDPSAPTVPESALPDIDDWVAEMDGRNIRQLGDALASTSVATTVRIRDGKVVLTDGPFAETKEQICGFDVVECADLDEAVDVASKHPMAWRGMIEVRPFWTPETPS